MPKTANKFSALKRAALMARNYKHGYAPRSGMSAEYKVWTGMKKRCADKTHPNYGGRGIHIAPEWLDDFPAFFAYVGKRPSATHHIDRINNDGHYEPGNVRWATPTQNVRNRRNNVLITINGKTKCASAWDEHCQFNRDGKVVLNRYKRGWRGAKLLAPIGTIKPAGRMQSSAERAKRSATFKRLHAKGVFKTSGAKISATKRKQFSDGTAYNERDKRGCFA